MHKDSAAAAAAAAAAGAGAQTLESWTWIARARAAARRAVDPAMPAPGAADENPSKPRDPPAD